MKKVLMIFIFLFLGFYGFSQNNVSYFLVNKIIEQCEGTIIKETEYKSDTSYTIVVKVPKFYDYDLVKSSVNVVVNKYEDITSKGPWKTTDGEWYDKIYIITYKEEYFYVLLSYNETKNLIIFLISSKE